jgi:hypothetical protein
MIWCGGVGSQTLERNERVRFDTKGRPEKRRALDPFGERPSDPDDYERATE